MSSTLCDTCDKDSRYMAIKAENTKLRTFLGGGSIVTDYWKDEDGTMHVLTTDGEYTYEYMRGGLADENAKLRKLMSEGAEVGKALLHYRDNPPVKHAGPIEGTWYTTGEILSIIMDKPEFSNGELLTRLAYLMGVRE